ncbi:MAG: hypothetical protein FWF26_05840, partial [Treponema sp.]|nr:hypothetical protein [Treponema sp.]
MWLFRSGIVVVLYVAITIYTGARLLNFVKYFVPSFRAFIFWPLYLLLCFSYILLFFLRVDNIQFLRNPAMLSLPFIAYFFMGLLLLDILRLVLCLAHVIPASPFYPAMGAGIALVFALLSMVYGYYHARDIATTHYDITINKEAGESESRLRVAVV